jgi:hypothetical protein
MQEKQLYGFRRVIEEEVYQTAQDAHTGGKNQMESLLTEPDFLANAQQPLPVAAKERLRFVP